MGKGSKFKGLSNYFENLEEDRVELTFQQIEGLIGEKLCNSAYIHKEYWYVDKTHTFPNNWLDNNYRMISLDLKNQRVVFVKNGSIGTEHKLSTSTPIERLKISTLSKKQPSIHIDKVISAIKQYYEDTTNSSNSRYLSWEHCYNVFLNAKSEPVLTEEHIDYLSLHLAFYLASWGMLRGSSFLLQKDYKVHTEIVKELYKPEYNNLWDLKCTDLKASENMDNLFKLIARLQSIYDEQRRGVKEVSTDISNILVTKVLLGTMGCLPAYDEYFKRGVGEYNVATQQLGKSSVMHLVDYYIDNEDTFECIRTQISESREVNYPQMKVLDMAFWQLGFDFK